jgi:hypothetical protein
MARSIRGSGDAGGCETGARLGIGDRPRQIGAQPVLSIHNGEKMTGFYRPPLDGFEESPFARDGEDRLIRREYWLGLSDRSLVMLMVQGIGTRLTADEKRAHLKDIRREHLADQILAPEILPPER